MPKLKDRVGKTYGYLIVLSQGPNKRYGKVSYIQWLCRCTCGNELYITACNLETGNSTSCGCIRRVPHRNTKKPRNPNTRYQYHGMAGNYDKRSEYGIWIGIKQRCNNPNQHAYKDYGGRGIKICKEWEHDFSKFLSYIGTRPSKQHSLDRMDNNGNYEPGNVKWSTRKEQQKNRRTVAELQAEINRLKLLVGE